jgi:hypothetical protein
MTNKLMFSLCDHIRGKFWFFAFTFDATDDFFYSATDATVDFLVDRGIGNFAAASNSDLLHQRK